MAAELDRILHEHYVPDEKKKSMLKRIRLIALATEVDQGYRLVHYNREMEELVALKIVEKKETHVPGLYVYTLTESGKEIYAES